MSHTTKASKAADTMRSPRMNGEAGDPVQSQPQKRTRQSREQNNDVHAPLEHLLGRARLQRKIPPTAIIVPHPERDASLHSRELHPVYSCSGARASRFSASRLLGRRQRRTRDRRHGAGTVVHGGFRHDLRASRLRRLVMRQSATRKSWQRSAPTNGNRDSACADRGLAAIRSQTTPSPERRSISPSESPRSPPYTS
jgi:hypothetical protein